MAYIPVITVIDIKVWTRALRWKPIAPHGPDYQLSLPGFSNGNGQSDSRSNKFGPSLSA